MRTTDRALLLYEALDGLDSLLEELVALAGRQQEALTTGNHLEVMSLTEAQQELIGRLSSAEEQCREIAAGLAGEMGCSREQPLPVLASRLPAPLGTPLRQAGERLAAAYREWHKLSAVNRRLAGDALEYVGFALNLLLAGQGKLYRPDGQAVQVKQDLKLMDFRV